MKGASDGMMDEFFITYCSGSSALAYPKSVAKTINPMLLTLLEGAGKKRTRWGIIAMDFPGADICKLIVDSNFHLSF